MKMELTFLLYLVFLVIVFLVIIYFRKVLCSKALGFESLRILVFKTFLRKDVSVSES
jgi:hypothetical protein